MVPCPFATTVTIPPPADAVTVCACSSCCIDWNLPCISCACCRIFMKSAMAKATRPRGEVASEWSVGEVEIEGVDRAVEHGVLPPHCGKAFGTHHLVREANRRRAGCRRLEDHPLDAGEEGPHRRGDVTLILAKGLFIDRIGVVEGDGDV